MRRTRKTLVSTMMILPFEYSDSSLIFNSLQREQKLKAGGKSGGLIEQLEKHGQECWPKPR